MGHTVRIAGIEAILRNGASQAATDGTRVSYDFDALLKELRQLRAEDDLPKHRRPVAASIDSAKDGRAYSAREEDKGSQRQQSLLMNAKASASKHPMR